MDSAFRWRHSTVLRGAHSFRYQRTPMTSTGAYVVVAVPQGKKKSPVGKAATRHPETKSLPRRRRPVQEYPEGRREGLSGEKAAA